MAKEQFRTTNFRSDSLEKIEQMDAIIQEYQGQGLRLTARQLYYQFVSRDLIPNKDTEYKKLTALLTDARYAGMIDWDAIEDRGREPNTPNEWDDLQDRVSSALHSYRLPRWKGQPKYVELWVEKQALAGVLEPIAYAFHATLMVNKGYSSASAMKESAERIKQATITDEEHANTLIEEFGKYKKLYETAEPDKFHRLSAPLVKKYRELVRQPIVLYLGDHDPSGEDMVRDIDERLSEFGVQRLKVEKVGLTIAQVKQYNPPPNPAKITDPRAKDYIAKFGNSSWEVDALPPNVLTRLISAAFAKHIDKAAMDAVKAQEERDKELLTEATSKIMKKRDAK